jgi:hypothetical protein
MFHLVIKVKTMKKPSNKGNVEAVETAVEEAVTVSTFEQAVAAIPAKERRTFNESEFAKIVDIQFPNTYEEVVGLVKTLGSNEIFALCIKVGKQEVVRVAKLFLENADNLRPSAVAGLKSASGGKTAYFAGCLTYSLLSFKKHNS